jgi:hypothetical protein
MAQKTDLNISPYYDDFDESKNFYKVLFKPGYPVQARELTTLQSILQNQVESFGNNIFKEGSVVLPGAITFDNEYSAVKLNATNLGVDVSLYIKNFIGKTIIGQSSGVSATVKNVVLSGENSLVQDLTIYVKYSQAGNDSESSTFEDGESLISNENISYGSTTIPSGTSFATLISLNATSTGSSASIDDGVYFVRGFFVDVSKQTLILDYYTNTPSYRVGLKISEITVNAKDDESLNDNAKGFTNFAAPGADRFKIDLTLTKKSLTDFNDTNFIEILRVDDGKIKKIVDKTVYNIVRDYIAERTFDESGHYTVDEFELDVLESLNDRIDNDGLFLENETTEQGNTPSDNLMCVQVSPGKAYVAGYDVELDSTATIDVEKPRDTQNSSDVTVPFEMGHLLRVNNASGAPKESDIVTLKTQFKLDNSGQKVIGQARVYTFNLRDAAYTNESSQWDLYLYDIQTYTTLTFNRSVTTVEIPASSFIQGKSSGASGFVVSSVNGTSLDIYQTSGTFVNDEQLIVNGVNAPLALRSFDVYGIRDIKSVAQNASGFPTFQADTVLSRRQVEGISQANFANSTGVFTSPGKLFTGIKEGDVIRYQDGTDLRYNRVSAVGGNLTTITVTNITTVPNVFDGAKGANGTYNIELAVPELRNNENASLFANLPDSNISSVNLSNSQLIISKQIDQTANLNVTGNTLTFDISNIAGITSAFFEPFDQERYSLHYSGGGISTITSDSFNLSSNVVTISGLQNTTNVTVNTTLKKNGIQSKIKEYTRSALNIVNLSTLVQSGAATSDSINDGLTYNEYYGLRVQDNQISLNVPDVVKVLAIYESTNTIDPTLDVFKFSSISQVDTDAIIGEDIIGSDSGALARIVLNSSSGKPYVSTHQLGIVYLNDQKFAPGENITFKESNIISTLESITLGGYKNITNNFDLDKGQRNEYYDYSRLVRVGSQIPERRLLIVYDHYTVPSSDNGDVFTILSYDADRFSEDIPNIGSQNIRASDTLDFRPRVAIFNPAVTTDKSPFDFASRSFGTNNPKLVLKPGEGSLIGYDFYLPRIDRIYLDKFGSIVVRKGVSSTEPVPPENEDNSMMQLSEISLPAYLYNTDDAEISTIDNRRYTMRDIGDLEDRVENLERVTSLSLLEVSTESLRVEDSEGNNRFKSGIFVDDFNDKSLSDDNLTTANIVNGQLRPFALRNSLQQRPIPAVEIAENIFDSEENYELLDPNVQKTGNVITLKYDSIDWLTQSFATRVENVNPFHIVEYNGLIKLSPNTDTWVRTIRLQPRVIRRTTGRTITRNIQRRGRRNRRFTTVSSTTNVQSNTQTVLVSSGREKYIRSRNISFFGTLFRPLAKHYQFLDNHSNVDFIPKLIEISPDSSNSPTTFGSSNSSFQTGETIRVYNAGKRIGTFRLASSNHKTGKFNSPATTYTINPYISSESISSAYSQSSKTINIDLNSLSSEAQGSFSGYFEKGAKIVGQSSGAIAYVKDLRLIADINGTLFGSFFIKNPHVNPAPNPRILTGKKTYRLSSSSTNETPLPGSKLISAGDATYTANGIFRNIQRVTTITTDITTTVTNVRVRRSDPLAQTFTVGKDIEAPDFSGDNDDDNGVFLTELDLFFASKPSGDEPITVEIRSVELGIPTLNRIGESKTLLPGDITTSTNGETATRVTFDRPVYLPPGQEYAMVLLAPNTDQYEVWIAKMGEKTIATANLPNSESVRYSRQFALGSLFKSQNGSTWTPAQESDIKFKLYKAKFTANTGIAHFGNPPLDSSNGYIPTLQENAITTLPKNVTIGITTISSTDSLVGILTAGRRIAGAGNSSGTIVSTGSSVTAFNTTNSGVNYTTRNNVSTVNVFGQGSGLTLDIDTVGAGGSITGLSINNPGTGYQEGDIVTLTNGANETGRNAFITISQSIGLDTLYLTNVQGSIPVGNLVYYNTDNTIVSLGNTNVVTSTEDSNIFSGNYLQVQHFNHGMYANNNKLILSDIQSSSAPTVLKANLSSTITAGGVIEVNDSSIFQTFEGQSVNATNIGYAKIGDEIVGYSSATTNQLTVNARAVEGIVQDHNIGDEVFKYEFNGISLRRINNVVYDISDTGIESDSYYIEIDRGATSTIEGKSIGLNRLTDGIYPQASFASELIGGGSEINASENIMFNRINPRFNILSPGRQTSVTSNIRTTSGTSIDGSEVSFNLQNIVEPVVQNQENELNSVRIVCSRTNELNQSAFDNVSGRRSFNSAMTLNTTNENLSPMIFLNDSTVEFISDNINRPVTNYTTDSSANSVNNDPHEAVYVSSIINLAQSASSLKVILTAYKPQSADIRVLYSLVREDSTEIEQEFELFPGFNNLESTSNGTLKVINPALNDGRPDVRVPDSQKDQYLEYEFTSNDLLDFSGYRIKIVMSSTNQATYPIIRDLRTIALK